MDLFVHRLVYFPRDTSERSIKPELDIMSSRIDNELAALRCITVSHIEQIQCIVGRMRNVEYTRMIWTLINVHAMPNDRPFLAMFLQ